MAVTKCNWQQMDLLSEPAGEDIRIELVNALADKLVKADAAMVAAAIKSHRLNEKEAELLMELLQVNYIMEVTNYENVRTKSQCP